MAPLSIEPITARELLVIVQFSIFFGRRLRQKTLILLGNLRKCQFSHAFRQFVPCNAVAARTRASGEEIMSNGDGRNRAPSTRNARRNLRKWISPRRLQWKRGKCMSENRILLIEDNDDDRELAILAFKQGPVKADLIALEDGKQALDYLFAAERFAAGDSNGMPRLVLLDLKMPKIDGLEVLRRVRADPRTRFLPVVILTSSMEQSDIVEAYRLGANSYLRKPVDFLDFVETARQISRYWLTLNQAPPIHAG
jgi:two-component system response regulator